LLHRASLRNITGLVGPNGAGKTTLLHIAMGLLEPTAGSIEVLGERPNDPILLSHIGVVTQDTPLYKKFTVEELRSFGTHMNRNFDATFARSRMDRLQIPPGRKAAELSGGQRAQVALTLALAKHPEILLLDEPLASLDPLARREFLQSLMEGVADGATAHRGIRPGCCRASAAMMQSGTSRWRRWMAVQADSRAPCKGVVTCFTPATSLLRAPWDQRQPFCRRHCAVISPP
jgi:ABC-type uncharacterized transport system YnjBCD ATPase subunit